MEYYGCRVVRMVLLVVVMERRESLNGIISRVKIEIDSRICSEDSSPRRILYVSIFGAFLMTINNGGFV